MTQETTAATSPLLEAALNLSRFHREHEKFYASAPRERAVVLQRHARTLHALADRWATASPSTNPAPSPFAGADDLNDPAALQLDGVLFMEGEGRPAEITNLIRDLRAMGDEYAGTLRPGPAATVAESREYVESMLGLQVWAHGVYRQLLAEPHQHAGAHAHR